VTRWPIRETGVDVPLHDRSDILTALPGFSASRAEGDWMPIDFTRTFTIHGLFAE